MREVAEDMAFRFKMHIYMAYNNTVEEYSPTFKQTTLGLPMFLVLMIILIVTILNTMISSVYERIPEIFTYSSVGLSPLHVSGLFLAESLTTGLIGGLLGYMLGTGFDLIFDLLNILQTLHPNFTSAWIPGSLLIVLGTTLVSTLYPMSKASRLVTPGVKRSWELPPPVGDEYLITLPFKPSKVEVTGVMKYVLEFLETHRAEKEEAFTSDELKMERKQIEEGELITIYAKTRHAPWDLGISNIVEINALLPKDSDMCDIEIRIKRLSGYTTPWKNAVKKFYGEIRDQFRYWKGLSPQEKEKYGVKYRIEREKKEERG